MTVYSLEDLVMIEDDMRPQTTTGYHNEWETKPFDFPNAYITDPFPAMIENPISTYTDDRNIRFAQRYGNKNIA